MKRNIGSLLILSLMMAGGLMAGPRNPKVSRAFDNTDSSKAVDVIVRYKAEKSGVEEKTIAKVKAKGAREKRRLKLLGATAFSGLPTAALDEVASDPDVVAIAPDLPLQATADLSVETTGAFLAAQYGYTGRGVGVAVIDSGISHNPDLRIDGVSRVVYSESFVPGEPLTDDKYGHGTHVAGILAGDGSLSRNGTQSAFVGIAPAVSLLDLRVLDASGRGSDSSVISAIERAIALKNTYNIRIINLSLGRPVLESYTTDPLCQAVEAAWRAGIFVVVAAGNSGRDNTFSNQGYGTIYAPGNDPYVLTVGAMRAQGAPTKSDDALATYSSKGPTLIDHVAKPDLVAPGNRVISLVSSNKSYLYKISSQNLVPLKSYQTVRLDKMSTDYFQLSGTSMATPMVAGAAALLLEQDPQLTPDQLKARLMKTAFKALPATTVTVDAATGKNYVSYYDLFSVGAGYLDIPAALANSEKPAGSAMSPYAVYDTSKDQVQLVFGDSVLWGTSLLWGTSIVWGTSNVQGTTVLWGTSICWGTTTSSAFSVLWGTNSPWAKSVLWGTTTAEPVALSINGE